MNKIAEQTLITLIDQLRDTHLLSKEEWIFLIENRTRDVSEYLFSQAREVRHRHYGHEVYIRGLIEFTNYCRNDCIYCGIRKSNLNACRYRLSETDIRNCCRTGYELGFRTFVLQGGEDGWFTDQKIISLIEKIKTDFPDCAITLSIGEKERESYQAFFDAGADRYLLRHETYNSIHYGKLHPPALTAAHRQRCLYDLKEIGYQTGTGFMVGSPYQTAEHLAEDMLFIQQLNPHMVGIGPFIPHHDTPFAAQPAGTLELTLFMLGLLRLMIPKLRCLRQLRLERSIQTEESLVFLPEQMSLCQTFPRPMYEKTMRSTTTKSARGMKLLNAGTVWKSGWRRSATMLS